MGDLIGKRFSPSHSGENPFLIKTPMDGDGAREASTSISLKFQPFKGTMSAGAHALSSPVGRFLRGVFLRRFV